MSNDKELLTTEADQIDESVEDTQSDSAPVEAVPEKAAKKSIAGIIAILLALIAIALTAAASWFGYQQLEQYQSQISQLNRQLASASSSADGFQSQAKAQQQQLQAILANQEQLQAHQHQSLEATLAQLKTELASQSSSMVNDAQFQALKVAEIKHLIAMANDTLLMTGDKVRALALLTLAEQRIQQAELPKMQMVRQALIEDITALKMISPIDRTEIVLKLMAMQNLLKQLPLISISMADAAESNTIDSLSKDLTWHENLSRALKELGSKWFEIKQHQQPVMPMLDNEQRVQLMSNLQLLMQHAQIAVMDKDQKLFNATLGQAKTLIAEYFDRESEAVKNYLQELDAIATANLVTALPTSLKSYQLMSQAGANQ